MAQHLLEFALPNGRVIQCLNLAGVTDMAAEMADYFRHGIDVRPGDVVFDVGANIGIFSVTVFDRCGGDVDVFAFEPIPCVHELLARNVRQCDPVRVRTFACGLAEADGTATFAYYPRMSVWSSTHGSRRDRALDRRRNRRALLRSIDTGRAAPWLLRVPGLLRAAIVDLLIRRASKTEPVQCALKTCSQVVREQGVERIDLLKIDVEKSELAVLRGIDAEHWPAIRQIVIEVHDADRDEIRALLAAKGFAIAYEQDDVQRSGNLGLLYARRLTESSSNGTSAGTPPRDP